MRCLVTLIHSLSAYYEPGAGRALGRPPVSKMGKPRPEAGGELAPGPSHLLIADSAFPTHGRRETKSTHSHRALMSGRPALLTPWASSPLPQDIGLRALRNLIL